MVFVEMRRLGVKNKFFDCLGTRGVAREIIKKQGSFCGWLFLVSIIFSRFIHVVACIRTSFLFVAEYPIVVLYGYTTLCLSINHEFGCLHFFWLL